MLYRAASSSEAFELVEILVERQQDSRYAGRVEIDEVLARKIIAHAIHRHGGTNEGATFVKIAEQDGEILAFVFGQLARVYMFGKALASDAVLLIGRRNVSPFVLDRLFDHYVEWAAANPKVHEIGGSWANTIEGAERFGAAMKRRGFDKIGEVYSRVNTRAGEEEPA